MPDVLLLWNKRIVLFVEWIVPKISDTKKNKGFAVGDLRVLFIPN